MKNHIQAFMHCAKCLEERPVYTSPREYAQLEVGWTQIGIQVWCKRHECNVVHLDFMEQKVRHCEEPTH